MASPAERRAELTSSTHLLSAESASLNATARRGHDAAACICAHLIVHHGLSRVRVAQAVGVPSLVVEESIRNGVSSATLRAQLRNWLFEVSSAASPQKLRVPDALFTQLQEDCAADELARQQQHGQGNGAAAASVADDRSPFSALDPISQHHFRQLQHSVGQSFISILNDPGEPTANVDWSTWLGGKLYEAFDFNGRVGGLEEVLRAYAAGQTGPESSAALLAEYPPSQDFSGYVRLISEAYQVNRLEGIANDAREWREDGALDGVGSRAHVGSATMVDGGPWPTGVPRHFFAAAYNAAAELQTLSDAVGESLPAAATSPHSSSPHHPATTSKPTGKAPSSDSRRGSNTNGGGAATDAAAALPTQVVDNSTFAVDYEYLESRNKELRAWESAVEKCLLQHVKHRSEDFFATSRTFGTLSGDARAVLADAREAREGGMRAGEHFIAEYLRIGQLYRRRQNFVRLQATATTAQQVLQRLRNVENWAALPERDLSEVLTISSALVDLETAVRGAKDAEQGIAWASLSRLHCLAEVPARVRTARKAVEQVVLGEYCRVLLSDLSAGEAGQRVAAVCESVTRLGVLNAANHLYLVKAVELLQVTAQESLVGLFMNAGALDDAKANELLAVAGNAVALALPDTRQQLCGFAKYLRFPSYQQVLQQFVDGLVDLVTQVSQNWGFFVTGGLRVALAMFDNRHTMIEAATRDLFGRLCGEAESLIASLLEAYATSGPQLTSMAEAAQLARASVQFPLRITSDVAGRIVSLLREEGAGDAAPGAPPSPHAVAADEPAGFRVYRPSRVIGTTLQRVAKRCFRNQHNLNKERVAMVTEGETWAAKEAVDAAIQQQVEDMCTVAPAALRAFRLRSLQALAPSGDAAGDGPHHRFHHRSVSRTLATHDAGVADDELLSAGATKLYVRVRGGSVASGDGEGAEEAAEEQEQEGRIVPNSLLVLVDLLHRYHDCVALFPFLAFDVASRMSELLDAYEGQAAAMVLGARAVEKGTLSTITTQHLCVASQCVAFLIEFIPALQAHLAAALQGSALDASQRGRAPRDVLEVANALGLVAAAVLPPSDAAPEKARLFIDNDWNRVVRKSRAHRNEFFSKMGSLVYRKVESLGTVSVQKGRWSAGGNEWVMAMLREVARLMRALRPLLPPGDMDGVVVPLLGSLSVMLREVTVRIPATAGDERATAASDVMLFRANVEKFGYDVLKCAEVTSVAAVMQGGASFAPVSTEEAVLRWFLPPPAAPSSPAKPTGGAP